MLATLNPSGEASRGVIVGQLPIDPRPTQSLCFAPFPRGPKAIVGDGVKAACIPSRKPFEILGRRRTGRKAPGLDEPFGEGVQGLVGVKGLGGLALRDAAAAPVSAPLIGERELGDEGGDRFGVYISGGKFAPFRHSRRYRSKAASSRSPPAGRRVPGQGLGDSVGPRLSVDRGDDRARQKIEDVEGESPGRIGGANSIQGSVLRFVTG